jgi:hypothetical protein
MPGKKLLMPDKKLLMPGKNYRIVPGISYSWLELRES